MATITLPPRAVLTPGASMARGHCSCAPSTVIHSTSPSGRGEVAEANAEQDHLRRVRDVMLQQVHSAGQAVMAAERIAPLDRARTFITLLVVLQPLSRH